MASYLVERYLPGLSVGEVRAATVRVNAAAEEMTADGIPVDYLGSLYVPKEEACFCHFEGTSPDAVAEANERAGFPFARIVLVECLAPAGAHRNPRHQDRRSRRQDARL